jgi:predicted secreted protein
MTREQIAIAALGVAAVACRPGTDATKPTQEPPASAKVEPATPPPVDAATDAAADTAADPVADAGAHASAHAEHGEAGAATEAGAKDVVTIDESHEGKTIDLVKGQSLVVLLGANPASGFDWAVLKAPPALGEPKMGFIQGGEGVGVVGKRRLTFSPKGPLPAGEHAVELGYRRSFEEGKPPFKTFRFKVRGRS